MYTSENAPRDYTGPIKLNAAQIAQTAAATDQWTQTLIAQARDNNDPETRDNARTLLTNRNLGW